MTSVSEEYGIERPTVHDIVKSEDKLKTIQTELEGNDCAKKRRAIRRSDLPELYPIHTSMCNCASTVRHGLARFHFVV